MNYNQTYYQNNRDKRKAQIYERANLLRQVVLAWKDKPCKDCGVQYHEAAMQFDHVKGEKKFNIAHYHRVGLDKLVDELMKCEIVCANCHAVRTFNRMAPSSMD